MDACVLSETKTLVKNNTLLWLVRKTLFLPLE